MFLSKYLKEKKTTMDFISNVKFYFPSASNSLKTVKSQTFTKFSFISMPFDCEFVFRTLLITQISDKSFSRNYIKDSWTLSESTDNIMKLTEKLM